MTLVLFWIHDILINKPRRNWTEEKLKDETTKTTKTTTTSAHSELFVSILCGRIHVAYFFLHFQLPQGKQNNQSS